MKKLKFVAVLFLAFLAACSESATNTNSSSNPSFENADQTVSTTSGKNSGGGGGGGRELPLTQQVSLNQAEQTQTAPVVVERKIIRNADLQLEANAPEEAQQKITQIAESKGGFVVESTQSSSDAKATTRDTVTMTVRVPSAKFDEALSEIRQTASRVIVESVKGQDVTEEFIDIEARLKTQKALEAQFLEIMKRSNSVEDALNVQTEIARVRGEIEKIEGRKRFLESQASLSTVKIKLQSPTAFSANSTGFFYQLKEAFGSGFAAALNFILILVKILIALLPFLILIVLPIYLLIRYILRKNRKQKLASDIAREEIKSD
ncbi:MAG: DUF4349 domain-containing protein [Acidobacteria bacterium]|nr:DUF4349 domain-containing protein [Acidobacteriota bacterium]